MERLLVIIGCIGLALVAGYVRRKQAQDSDAPRMFPELRAKLESPKLAGAVAIAAALFLAGLCIGGYQLRLKPMRQTLAVRSLAHTSLMRLYELQMSHFRARNAFANDVDSLLASAPDGPQLRANLKASVDMNTLVVAGDAHRFKLEINILDAQRTPIKIRGPDTPEPAEPVEPEPQPLLQTEQ